MSRNVKKKKEGDWITPQYHFIYSYIEQEP